MTFLNSHAMPESFGSSTCSSGQALDRTDVHPWPGDVGQLRCHNEVDARAFELPGEPAQLAWLGPGRPADRDRVGAQVTYQAEHVPAGEDRDRRV